MKNTTHMGNFHIIFQTQFCNTNTCISITYVYNRRIKGQQQKTHSEYLHTFFHFHIILLLLHSRLFHSPSYVSFQIIGPYRVRTWIIRYLHFLRVLDIVSYRSSSSSCVGLIERLERRVCSPFYQSQPKFCISPTGLLCTYV